MSDSQLAKPLDFEEEFEPDIIYPESDGQPMADNTKQFDWITNIVQNLRTQFQNEPNVFIAGNLLWYPVKGQNEVNRAPDVMVAFGRPKHHRSSYKQWLEDKIAPQVVFEIRSPSNNDSHMVEKLQFYQGYEVEEYYMYDPEKGHLKGWIRGGNQMHPIAAMSGWKSPRLGIRFERVEKELYLYHPDGSRFTSHQEEATHAKEEAAHAKKEAARADKEAARADKEAKRAEEETKARLAEKQRADAGSRGQTRSSGSDRSRIRPSESVVNTKRYLIVGLFLL